MLCIREKQCRKRKQCNHNWYNLRIYLKKPVDDSENTGDTWNKQYGSKKYLWRPALLSVYPCSISKAKYANTNTKTQRKQHALKKSMRLKKKYILKENRPKNRNQCVPMFCICQKIHMGLLYLIERMNVNMCEHTNSTKVRTGVLFLRDWLNYVIASLPAAKGRESSNDIPSIKLYSQCTCSYFRTVRMFAHTSYLLFPIILVY